MTQSFLWYDYETFGSNPRRCRPAQFAAIRTDANLNEIGKPLVLYCRPPQDVLPEPQSCFITGITPQQCEARGLREADFAQRIAAALTQPDTIGVGYNAMRFDSEVTRFLLWRNLRDPYAQEWQEGCSRWDVLDALRCARALRPDGIQWPTKPDGTPSLKLEHMSAANGLAHESAHDALSDVRATIALARLLRRAQPKLFDFCLALRDKRRVMQELHLPDALERGRQRPFLHISGMFGDERGCLAVMAPLAMHPNNRNELIAWDLSADPSELEHISPEEARARLFTRAADMPDGVPRLAIKSVHINRAPVVMGNINMLSKAQAERWRIDPTAVQRHLAHLLHALSDLSALWNEVYAPREGQPAPDVDEALYGGFISDEDRRRLARLLQLTPQEAALDATGFDDARLPELVFRWRARNWPETLNAEEAARWRAHCAARVLHGAPGYLSLQAFSEQLDAIVAASDDDERTMEIAEALSEWGERLGEQLSS